MKYLPEYSNFVQGVDTAFFFILGISFFFLIGLTIIIIVFVIRYNHKRHPKPVQMKDNYVLEIAWTVIPLIIVLFMFYYGYIGYMPMRNAPDDAMIVKTEGRMWEWEFTYENGKSSQDLYIPINKPVKLLMTSTDVIHSLYIPKFRVKEDLVPGKETMMWFIPLEIGKYEILCAEYCGLRHSYMISYAHVMTENDFNTWLADFDSTAVKDHEGLILLRKNACTGCHSLDGTTLVGSSFKGLYGSQKKVTAGSNTYTITVDDNYIKKSIYDPNAELAEGYSANLMQSYKDVITDEEVNKIIDFIKELK